MESYSTLLEAEISWYSAELIRADLCGLNIANFKKANWKERWHLVKYSEAIISFETLTFSCFLLVLSHQRSAGCSITREARDSHLGRCQAYSLSPLPYPQWSPQSWIPGSPALKFTNLQVGVTLAVITESPCTGTWVNSLASCLQIHCHFPPHIQGRHC